MTFLDPFKKNASAGQPEAKQNPPPAAGAGPADAPNQMAGVPLGEVEQTTGRMAALAKQKLYGDETNFSNMMAMFENGKEEGFPQAMSTVVNTILDQLEQEEGEQQPEVLAAVGLSVIASVAEDLEQGGAMKVDEDLMVRAQAKTMQDWMTNHPERVDTQKTMQEYQELLGQGGPPAEAPVATPAATPAPGPSGGSFMGGMT